MAWSSILGHDRIRQQFEVAHARQRLGHAYLFVGPAGVGKNLFAHEFARALLCHGNGGKLLACDHCAECKLEHAGTHPDLFVVRKPEDKSELPIDTIRHFCTEFGLKSSRGHRKVAIIEDADYFNDESANGLLKTLEEPPPGSTLILLSTSLESQLSTIRSRCQTILFQPLPMPIVKAALRDRGEKDDARAERLALMSGGSLGRALELQDESLWDFRKDLLIKLTERSTTCQYYVQFWNTFVEKDATTPGEQRLRASLGIQMLSSLLSDCLRVTLGMEPAGRDADELRRLRLLGEKLGVESLTDLLDRCHEADYHIDRMVQVVLVVELLAVRVFSDPLL